MFRPPASLLSPKHVSVNSLDSLAELRSDKHAGSSLRSTERRWSIVESDGGATEGKVKVKGQILKV